MPRPGGTRSTGGRLLGDAFAAGDYDPWRQSAQAYLSGDPAGAGPDDVSGGDPGPDLSALGVAVEAVRRFAGHSTVEMVLRYAHLLDPQDEDQLLRALGG